MQMITLLFLIVIKMPVFGGMLQELVLMEALEFRSEPLDGIVERKIKVI